MTSYVSESEINERSTEVGVIGAGLMGRDIAALFGKAGFTVWTNDIDGEVLNEAREYHESLGNEYTDGNYEYTTELESLSSCEFVVEAVNDRLELKKGIIDGLEDILSTSAIIGTNTSSLTARDLAKQMNFPSRMVLFHFANPCLERDLVEVSGDLADEEVIQQALNLGEAIGHTPIRLKNERRGNGLSRLSASIKCSASWELERFSATTIDKTARELGFDQGPVELMDTIGLDVHLDTVSNLSEEYGDRFEPPESVKSRMQALVDDGQLGKKTGRGLYQWENGDPVFNGEAEEYDLMPILCGLVNEANKMVEDDVADPSTINEILKHGTGGETGPFDILELAGTEAVFKTLKDRYNDTDAEIFEPAETLVDTTT